MRTPEIANRQGFRSASEINSRMFVNYRVNLSKLFHNAYFAKPTTAGLKNARPPEAQAEPLPRQR
jgi:hypothetical protein